MTDDRPRVGLVLGAGGIVGQAFHAGVLTALAHDLGWDARTADVIVGASAGSVTGTLLCLGVSAHDLAAWAVDAPLTVDGRELRTALEAGHGDFPPVTWRQALRPWRIPRPALLATLARRPWRLRPDVTVMTLLPAGRVDLESRLTAVGSGSDEEWPDGLRICAVRRDDGRRVVFGAPGNPTTTLARAVAASCAIPGYFRPVRIDGVEHFDGGVRSGTNADVLRGMGLDLVLALAPMSVAGGWTPRADLPVRRSAHRRLLRELQLLRDEGTEVVSFEPSASVLRAMGLNLMATDRSARVVQEALFDAGRRAVASPVAGRLDVLRSPRRHQATTALPG